MEGWESVRRAARSVQGPAGRREPTRGIQETCRNVGVYQVAGTYEKWDPIFRGLVKDSIKQERVDSLNLNMLTGLGTVEGEEEEAMRPAGGKRSAAWCRGRGSGPGRGRMCGVSGSLPRTERGERAGKGLPACLGFSTGISRAGLNVQGFSSARINSAPNPLQPASAQPHAPSRQ